jgi:hypothetical protein
LMSTRRVRGYASSIHNGVIGPCTSCAPVMESFCVREAGE